MMTKIVALVLSTFVACNSERRPPDPMPVSTTPISIKATDAALPPRLMLDLVSIDAGPAVVRVVGCPPDGVLANERVEKKVDLPAFAISRAPVTCEEYAECIRDGACRPLGSGVCNPNPAEPNAATEQHEQAANYCRWQHARLPTYAEWQRAVRGKDGDPFPTGMTFDRSAKCERSSTWPDSPRCLHRSAAGLLYSTRNVNGGEWTSSVGCVRTEEGLTQGPIATSQPGAQLWDVAVFQKVAEFRCAVDR